MNDEPREPYATLHFPLPECRDELMDALSVAKWQIVVWNLQSLLRERMKWGELSAAAYEEADHPAKVL